jgi:chromosome segregation ATPase
MSRSKEELDRIMSRAKANLDKGNLKPPPDPQPNPILNFDVDKLARWKSEAEYWENLVEQGKRERREQERQITKEAAELHQAMTSHAEDLIFQVAQATNAVVTSIAAAFEELRQEYAELELKLTETQTKNAQLEKKVAELEVRLLETKLIADDAQPRVVN